MPGSPPTRAVRTAWRGVHDPDCAGTWNWSPMKRETAIWTTANAAPVWTSWRRRTGCATDGNGDGNDLACDSAWSHGRRSQTNSADYAPAHPGPPQAGKRGAAP